MVRLGDGLSFGISPDGKWVTGYASREAAKRMYVLMPTGPGEEIPVRISARNLPVEWLPAFFPATVTIW